MRPAAPAGLCAFGSNPDSWSTTALMSAGSTPYFEAADRISDAYCPSPAGAVDDVSAFVSVAAKLVDAALVAGVVVVTGRVTGGWTAAGWSIAVSSPTRLSAVSRLMRPASRSG